MARRRKWPAMPFADAQPELERVFAECGLRMADFEVEYGRGKSILRGQRLVWMTVRHRASGRAVSDKIGTSKREADRQRDELLRSLLRSFRKS